MDGQKDLANENELQILLMELDILQVATSFNYTLLYNLVLQLTKLDILMTFEYYYVPQ